MCATDRTTRLTFCGALALMLACPLLCAGPATNEMAGASFDELLFHIQRYGSTEAKRDRKRAAREELFRREATALEYLMDHTEIENPWIFIMADNLVRRLSTGKAVPVLLRYIDADREKARKFATYWLGFHTAPEHSDVLLPLLEDETTAGSAMRTLGKWRIEAAIPGIRPYLVHKKERLRIRAVNALRDIGCHESVSDLVAATGDPVFTVRKAASRALAAYGTRAERQVIGALAEAEPPARRELISVLGSIQTRRSIRALRGLLKSQDPLIRETAARALLNAAPAKSGAWLEKAGINTSTLLLATP